MDNLNHIINKMLECEQISFEKPHLNFALKFTGKETHEKVMSLLALAGSNISPEKLETSDFARN